VKAFLGSAARGREIKEGAEGDQLREESAFYVAFFEFEKADISAENTSPWNVKR
jgi:hypothetical protein